jgi:hypothetical protein
VTTRASSQRRDRRWRGIRTTSGFGCSPASGGRIDQEEPFVGRTAEVGDDLGSRVIAARLVRDLMRLSFLLERRHAPYSKWLGSAFAQLDIDRDIGAALVDVLAAESYESREAPLVTAVEAWPHGTTSSESHRRSTRPYASSTAVPSASLVQVGLSTPASRASRTRG